MRKFFDEISQNRINTIKNSDEICKAILYKISIEYGISFPQKPANINYTQYLQFMLFEPSQKNYQPYIYDYLEKNKYNENNLIFRFLIMINNPKLPKEHKFRLEYFLRESPIVTYFTLLESGYYIETKNGNVEVYKLTETIKNEVVKYIMEHYNIIEKCHGAVEILYKEMPDTDIVTSQLNGLFNQSFYHSYFKDGDTVFDISSNTTYKNNTFNEFYMPDVLQVISTNDFEEECKRIPKTDSEDLKYKSKILKLLYLNKK